LPENHVPKGGERLGLTPQGKYPMQQEASCLPHPPTPL
jgi:hypothetical protein